MVGFARQLGAVLVAIVLVTAQVMPAWAGCHSQRHAAAMTTMTKVVNPNAVSHHAMSHTPDIKAGVLAADQVQPSNDDSCLGNCGCACGVGGAFVLAGATGIDGPQHIVALTLTFALSELPPGGQPDGPRRPPRTTA